MRVDRGSSGGQGKAHPKSFQRTRDSIPNDTFGDEPTKILYFNPDPFYGKCCNMMRRRGHAVVTAISAWEALALLRKEIFDALVVDCERDALDILAFTARVHRLQPFLPVFVAAEWAPDLANALDELAHGLAMFAEHESARLADRKPMA